MRRGTLVLVFAGLACASSWDQGWTKPGADAAAAEQARKECLQDAARGRGAGQFGYDRPTQQLFAECMRRNGWQQGSSD
jgi:hypothetical protein